GRRSGAKDEWVGRQLKCPGCGQKLLIQGPAAPAASQPPQARGPQPPRSTPATAPQARPATARPAQAKPPQARPAPAQPPQARPAPTRQPSRQAAPGGPRQAPPPPAGDGILDLLGGDFAADLGGAGLGPMAGGAAGNPLGLPPKRTRKSGSNKTLFIVLGSLAGVGLLVVCGGIGVALLLPAVQAARQAALRSQARNGATSATPVGPVWAPDPSIAGQLTTNAAFDRYNVQLPAGFNVAPAPPTPTQPGVKTQGWMWMSQPQPNGSHGIFSAYIADISNPLHLSLGSLEAALAGEMALMRKEPSISNFRDQPGERGQLAGKPFIRARFSASTQGIS